MNIVIKKYREVDGSVKNYFDNPRKIDEITFAGLPSDAMPRFTQRWIKNEKGFIIQYDNFSLKFSQLQTEISATGKNIRDFMMDGNNLFVVMVTIFDKVFGGTVVMSDKSPQADNTIANSPKWEVTMDCVSLEAEADRRLQTLPIERVPQDNMAFEDYIPFYFRNFVKSYITVNNQLNLSAKLTIFKGTPYTVTVSRPLQNNIWERGIGNNTAKILNSLSKEMGFVWEIKFAALQVFNASYFNVELKLSWKDSGPVRHIDPMTHIENINTANTTPFVLFPCMRRTIMAGTNPDRQVGWVYCGIIMSKSNHFSVDQYTSNPKFSYYTEDFTSFAPFPTQVFYQKGLHWVHGGTTGIPDYIPDNQLLNAQPDIWYSVGQAAHYNINDGNWSGVDIVYSRIFVRTYTYFPTGQYSDAGYNDILDFFTNTQNKFLASGAAKTKNLQLSLIANSHYDKFDKINIGTESYFLYELDGLNGFDYTVNSSWKQIT